VTAPYVRCSYTVSQAVRDVITPEVLVSTEYLIPLNITVSGVPSVYKGIDNTFPLLNVYNTAPKTRDVEYV
jgi:hypothetical protein